MLDLRGIWAHLTSQEMYGESLRALLDEDFDVLAGAIDAICVEVERSAKRERDRIHDLAWLRAQMRRICESTTAATADEVRREVGQVSLTEPPARAGGSDAE